MAKKVSKLNTRECEEIDGDSCFTLQEMLDMLPRLQKKYGKHALLRFNAGYNNVTVVIEPTKKLRSKKS